jgi:hypothetical protein
MRAERPLHKDPFDYRCGHSSVFGYSAYRDEAHSQGHNASRGPHFLKTSRVQFHRGFFGLHRVSIKSCEWQDLYCLTR